MNVIAIKMNLVGRVLIVSLFVYVGVNCMANPTAYNKALNTVATSFDTKFSEITGRGFPIKPAQVAEHSKLILAIIGGVLVVSGFSTVLGSKCGAETLVFAAAASLALIPKVAADIVWTALNLDAAFETYLTLALIGALIIAWHGGNKKKV